MTTTAERQMELTLPMVPDIEIAAARAVGNMAREMGMGSEHVDEMMHAVIEACINAREHSGCADNRIYLRFLGTSQGDGSRIDIWVTDHGKGFDPEEARSRRPTPPRRAGCRRHPTWAPLPSPPSPPRPRRGSNKQPPLPPSRSAASPPPARPASPRATAPASPGAAPSSTSPSRSP